ncbi:MAG TPA: zinc ribbon domain-containing protein [Chloroflexi bacterium]|nr:zinc ribbon domain-containing protein [Chloroflexota bacterium]
MPAYEFRCKTCRHTFTLLYGSYAEYEQATPRCPRCDSTDLSRLIRRVAILTSEESRFERWTDPGRLAGLEEDDPRAVGRLMREMMTEMGEEMDPEIEEVVERLEAGEDPETIEESLSLDVDGGDTEE